MNLPILSELGGDQSVKVERLKRKLRHMKNKIMNFSILTLERSMQEKMDRLKAQLSDRVSNSQVCQFNSKLLLIII